MAKTKMELKVPIDSGEIVFECEWELNSPPVIKRSGIDEFEMSLEDFEQSVKQVHSWVRSIKDYRSQ